MSVARNYDNWKGAMRESQIENPVMLLLRLTQNENYSMDNGEKCSSDSEVMSSLI